MYYSEHNDFSISNEIHSDLDTYVMINDFFNLSLKMGTRINGLIGFDVFDSFIVEIDYFNNKLILHNPIYYKEKRNRRKVSFSMEVINKKPYFTTKIKQYNDSIIGVKLLIDTGSSIALWLSANNEKGIKIPEKYKEDFLGKGLNGDIFGKLGRIEALYIDKYKFNNPTASFPDSASVFKTINLDGRNGSIGAEILRRFTVIINYFNKTISFKPNIHLNNEFNYDMSGIEINTPYPDFPIYIIYRIKKDSPADKAGLRKGDRIVQINNKTDIDFDLNDIYYIFQSKPNKKIRLKIQRENAVLNVEFTLQKDL